jgi:hypothetical protein
MDSLVATSLGILYTLVFVGSFHLTAPSSMFQLLRNDPLVIIHRIKSVMLATIFSILLTIFSLNYYNNNVITG